MNNKLLVALGIIVGLIFIVIGYVYATHSAGTLPNFFPGYTAGETHMHIKHAIASFVVGLACWIFAWFKSAPVAQSN